MQALISRLIRSPWRWLLFSVIGIAGLCLVVVLGVKPLRDRVLGIAAAAVFGAKDETPPDNRLFLDLMDQVTKVKGVLKVASTVPSDLNMSPYPTVLAMSEYELSDGSAIRVAHFALYDRLAQSFPGEVGQAHDLALIPAQSAPHITRLSTLDDLPVASDSTTSFVDAGQALRRQNDGRYPSLACRDKIQLFWQQRDRIKIASVGDSRTDVGFLPSVFAESFADKPAFNFAISGSALETAAVVIEDYLGQSPELEMVVLGLSPRMFHLGRKQDAAEVWNRAPAYQEFKKAVAAPDLEPDIKPASTSIFDSSGEFLHETDKAGDFDLEFRLRIKRALSDGSAFELDPKRLEILQRLIETCRQRDVLLFGFTPPFHPVTGTTVAATDGIGRETYIQWTSWLREQAATSDETFFFRDFDQAGNSGYEEHLFRDVDHLNRAGARVLSQELAAWIESTLSTPPGRGSRQ